MKVLIWIGSFIICLLATVIFDALLKPLGLRLGYGLRYLLSVSATAFLARRLCNKWEWHKKKSMAENKGLTPDEYDGYIKSEIPTSCYEIAELYRGCPTELNAYLKDCVKSGKITKEQSLYLYQEFSNK